MAALLVTYKYGYFFEHIEEDPDVDVTIYLINGDSSSPASYMLKDFPDGVYPATFDVKDITSGSVDGFCGLTYNSSDENTTIVFYDTDGSTVLYTQTYDGNRFSNAKTTSGSIALAPNGTQALMVTGGTLKISSAAVIDSGLTYSITNVHGTTQSVGVGSYITNSLTVNYSYAEEDYPKCVMSFTENGTTYTYDVYGDSDPSFTIPVGTTFIINSVTRPHR